MQFYMQGVYRACSRATLVIQLGAGSTGKFTPRKHRGPCIPAPPPQARTLIERHVGASRCGELGKLAHVRQDTQLVVHVDHPLVIDHGDVGVGGE